MLEDQSAASRVQVNPVLPEPDANEEGNEQNQRENAGDRPQSQMRRLLQVDAQVLAGDEIRDGPDQDPRAEDQE